MPPAGACGRARLVSTTTVFVRPWLKLCFTVPELTDPPVRGFRVRGLRPLLLSSLIRSLYLSPGGSRTSHISWATRLGMKTDRQNEERRKALGLPLRLDRLLAPILRKERTEPRQAPDIFGPTLGGSPRKEGGVYHILQP